MSGEPIKIQDITKINGKSKFLFKKNKRLTSELRKCFAMRLFSHILNMRPRLGTQILSKKQDDTYYAKINVYGFVLDKMQHISFTEFSSINCCLQKK